jgi:hypothetical protein
VAHGPLYRCTWGAMDWQSRLVHGLSVEHGDDRPMVGVHGRQGAWERSRWGGAGWGVVLVGALIVRMPLVRRMLMWHRSSSQWAGKAWLGAQRRQCVDAHERAAWPQKPHSDIGRGGGQWAVLGVAPVGTVQPGIPETSANSARRRAGRLGEKTVVR